MHTIHVLMAASEGAGSLEAAATKAGETGRKVAMSLIALGFALIFTASRVFHFAHGGVYTFAAFAGSN